MSVSEAEEMTQERFEFFIERMNIGMVSDDVWEWKELSQYPFEMWPEILRLRTENERYCRALKNIKDEDDGYYSEIACEALNPDGCPESD